MFQICHSGIVKLEGFCYPFITIVNIRISITFKSHHPTNYSKYQQYLFGRIKEYKEDFVTPIGYRKITKLFNSEGLKSPTNKTFYPSLVHSIYRRSKIREERFNSEVEVNKEMFVKYIGNKEITIYVKLFLC